MKIIFEKIRVKNFLSYGNSLTEFNLNENNYTVVVGENGVGKSTLLIDAITWVLKGKIQRKGITIDQVTNNINGKECYGELYFTIKNNSYKIVRGIKPNILELWINDKKQDQESSKKLIQNTIDDIVKIDVPTLSNICLLSINTTKPFVDLTPEETRNITETLLGIGVFSDMLKKVKEQIKNGKDAIKINEKDFSLYEELVKDGAEKLKRFKELEATFEQERTEKVDKLTETKNETKNEKIRKETIAQERKEELEKLDLDKKIERVDKDIDKMIKKETDLNGNIKTNYTLIELEEDKMKRLIDSGPICSTCSTKLTEEHREKEVDTSNKKIHLLTSDIAKYKEKAKHASTKKDELKEEIKKTRNIFLEKEGSISKKIREIKDLENKINSIDTEIEKVSGETIEGKISGLIDKDKIKEHVVKYKALKEENKQLKEKSKYLEVIKNILSDNGVKSEIIKKDIPYLNSLIIHYMKMFGKSFAIQFNESFGVELKGTQKRGLSYYSLSEGEKKRIDLVILLSFIDLIKKKNSINTNILVFDEIFDTSLDVEGTDIFIEILNQKIREEKLDNIFIISHNKNLSIPNSEKMEVYKDGNFSKIKRMN